jgi:hypothetical protein
VVEEEAGRPWCSASGDAPAKQGLAAAGKGGRKEGPSVIPC